MFRGTLRKQIEVDKLAAVMPHLRSVPRKTRTMWLAHFRRLADAPASRIARSLRSNNQMAREAARASLSIKSRPEFTVQERFQLARLLVAQIRGSTIRSRVSIDKALEILSKEIDAAPPDDRDVRSAETLTRQWSWWWGQVAKRAPGTSAAIGELARARELERQGKWSEAISLYRSLEGGTASSSSVQAGRRLSELADQGFILNQ